MAPTRLLVFPFTVALDGAGNMRDPAQGLYARALARALAERLDEAPSLSTDVATLTAHGAPGTPSEAPEEHGWVVATQPWTLEEALAVKLPEGTRLLLHGSAELTDRVRLRLLLVDQEKQALALDHVVLRPRGELFAALDEAAGAVAEALGHALPEASWPTGEVEAFVAFLRGRDMSAALEAGVHVSDPERAFDGYLEALRRDPEFEEAQARLLSLALDFALGGQGPRAAARAACEKLLAQDGRAYKALAALAEIDLAEHKPQDAEARLRALLDLRGDWWPAFERLGTALTRQGKHEEALAWFDRALAEKSNDPDALFGKALCLAEEGRLEEAVGLWRRVLPQAAGAARLPLHKNLAHALEKLGRWGEAGAHRDAVRELEGKPRFGVDWWKDKLRRFLPG